MQGSLAVVLIGVVVAYYNSFFGVFQFDDFNVIVENNRVHSWFAFLAELPFTIRPLLKFTYTLNWTSGLGLFGFHLFNLSIHLINTLLLYKLSLLIASKEATDIRLATSIALFTTIPFALHPIQTEAVTYISGRSSSLMAMFVFVTLLAYIRGAESRSKTLLYLISPLTYSCAIATKEVAIFLPLLLFAYNYLYLKDRSALKNQWAHWALFFTAIGFLGLTDRYRQILSIGLERMGFFENLDFTLRGIYYNLSKVFFVGQLNIDPTPAVLYDGRLLYWVTSLVVLSTAVIATKRHRWFGLSTVWFVVFLLPYFLVSRGDVINERNLYVSLPAFFFVLSTIFHSLKPNSGVRWALAVCLIALLCLLTYGRNSVYYSEIALWQDTLEKKPDSHRAMVNLGYAYSLKGMNKEAEEMLKKALEIAVE